MFKQARPGERVYEVEVRLERRGIYRVSARDQDEASRIASDVAGFGWAPNEEDRIDVLSASPAKPA